VRTRRTGAAWRAADLFLAALLQFSATTAFAQPASAPAAPALDSAPSSAPQASTSPAATSRAAATGKVAITIAKDTTVVGGPLLPDGTVDYITALNARIGRGVTADNDAAIPLLKALGPQMLDADVREQTLKALRLDLPAEGNYLSPPPGYITDGNVMGWPAFRRLNVLGQSTWLRENEAALNTVVEATKLPRFYLPIVESNHILTDGIRCRQVLYAADGLHYRAMWRQRRNDYDGARGDVLAAHRLVQLLRQQGSMGWLVTALETEQRTWAPETEVSAILRPGDTRRLLAEVEALPVSSGVETLVDSVQRFLALDAAMEIARSSLTSRKAVLQRLLPGVEAREANSSVEQPDPNVLDWDAILRIVNKRYDASLAAARRPTYVGRRDAFAALHWETPRAARADEPDDRSRRVRLLLYFTENQGTREQASIDAAEMLFWFHPPTARDVCEAWDYVSAERAIRMCQIALGAVARETGEYPARLTSVTPWYLKTVPVDPYTGTPLIYKVSQKGVALYSVGPNLKDDGGRRGPADGQADDIGFGFAPE